MIIYCCSDLIFATKICATARAEKLVSRPARDLGALTNRLQCVDDGRANDPVSALLVDMDHEAAVTLITTARAHDPDLPILAFGSHVAVELLASARSSGADTVMSRGQFTAELPHLLKQLAGRQGNRQNDE